MAPRKAAKVDTGTPADDTPKASDNRAKRAQADEPEFEQVHRVDPQEHYVALARGLDPKGVEGRD